MTNYTRYLSLRATKSSEFVVGITDASPIGIAQEAIKRSRDLRYSPILPAFLVPEEGPPPLPVSLNSITFFFANAPYKALGLIKPALEPSERSSVYFTQGLASILLVNSSRDRALEIATIIGGCPTEYWLLNDGLITSNGVSELISPSGQSESNELILPTIYDSELAVYVEQIAASLATLWAVYGVYFLEEKPTLRRLASFAELLIAQYNAVKAFSGENDFPLIRQEKANAILSAFVELSAALSYAVTQGTTGAMPILANRSPFPHHSLLGIGGSVRALTKFTRYLESAFTTRNAIGVINDQYSVLKHDMPANISTYDSGPTYQFPSSVTTGAEFFDKGGSFRQVDHVPLIAHFSLRHGFMEAKFCVTAASEALTAEILPPWTLMTLSHEIMHSRVRMIFQAIFGIKWSENELNVIRIEHYNAFTKWHNNIEARKDVPVDVGLRNAILKFCCAVEQALSMRQNGHNSIDSNISYEKLGECYSKHKQLAIETMVHFHDYYFAYACQPKMYLMSLWASWIKVAAPFTRPEEYLVRSLATIACGTGYKPREAFDFAVEKLLESLDSLQTAGVRSPLFDRLRELVTSQEVTPLGFKTLEFTREFFRPLYYLADQIRLFFASPSIASLIDRIDSDPFAEGSTIADDYTASIYVFGEETNPIVSPIRYSLATLFKSLSGKSDIDDPQWLTAWNYMVISSQEIRQC